MSRATHITAKATPAAQVPERAMGPGGGWRVARVEGEVRNTGDPLRRSNHPRGRKPVDKVRRLQRRLWAAAKRSPERRVHALYDRVCRGDILREAWRRLKRNKGAAGIDRQTLVDVEKYGEDRFFAELQAELRAGGYRPGAMRRRYIPKADGRKRPLGIPTVWKVS